MGNQKFHPQRILLIKHGFVCSPAPRGGLLHCRRWRARQLRLWRFYWLASTKCPVCVFPVRPRGAHSRFRFLNQFAAEYGITLRQAKLLCCTAEHLIFRCQSKIRSNWSYFDFLYLYGQEDHGQTFKRVNSSDYCDAFRMFAIPDKYATDKLWFVSIIRKRHSGTQELLMRYLSSFTSPVPRRH